MIKFNKEILIELIDDAKKYYKKLNQTVEEQKGTEKTNSNEIKLYNGIQRAFDFIEENPFYGRNVKKKLIPKYYQIKYNVENLFIVDLPLFWRFIYTLESNEIEINAFVLDIFDHDKYNKRFGFKKK